MLVMEVSLVLSLVCVVHHSLIRPIVNTIGHEDDGGVRGVLKVRADVISRFLSRARQQICASNPIEFSLPRHEARRLLS